MYALVERYYELAFTALPNVETINRVRQVVNDLKHRKGLIDRRRPEDRLRPILDRHDLGSNQAKADIKGTWGFLEALWGTINTK